MNEASEDDLIWAFFALFVLASLFRILTFKFGYNNQFEEFNSGLSYEIL